MLRWRTFFIFLGNGCVQNWGFRCNKAYKHNSQLKQHVIAHNHMAGMAGMAAATAGMVAPGPATTMVAYGAANTANYLTQARAIAVAASAGGGDPVYAATSGGYGMQTTTPVFVSQGPNGQQQVVYGQVGGAGQVRAQVAVGGGPGSTGQMNQSPSSAGGSETNGGAGYPGKVSGIRIAFLSAACGVGSAAPDGDASIGDGSMD